VRDLLAAVDEYNSKNPLKDGVQEADQAVKVNN